MAVHHSAGDRVNGCQILETLGMGGEGIAYKAKDKKGKIVVLKQNNFLASAKGHEVDLERSKRLKKLIGKKCPYVAELYDQFVYDGFIYDVWQYISGTTLLDVLDRKRKLPEEKVLTIAADALKALAWLHEDMGVIHRDIKLENMMLPGTKSGPDLVLIDLGIAYHAGTPRITTKGFVGTPLYMAPEMFLGGEAEVDGRADLYSLGVVMYECLSGAHPYPEMDFKKLMKRILRESPAPLKRVSDELSKFIATLMALNPVDRPTSAHEALAVVEGIVGTVHTTSVPILSPVDSDRGGTREKGTTEPETPEGEPRLRDHARPHAAKPKVHGKAKPKYIDPVAIPPSPRRARKREKKSPVPTAPTFRLRIMSGPLTGKTITIPEHGMTLGRGVLNPEDRRMSRFHIRVSRTRHGLKVVDLKSTNRVLHEERRRRRERLNPGAEFCLGDTALEYEA